jgi:type II secretory pathway component PulF
MKTSSAESLRDTLIVVLIAASAAGYLFLCEIVPAVVRSIVQQRRTIPLPTRALIDVSTFATNYWWLFACGVALAALGIARWFRSDPTGLEAIDRHLRRHGPVYALAGFAIVALALALVGFALLLPAIQIS